MKQLYHIIAVMSKKNFLMKKVLKIMGKVILVILAVLLLIVIVLFIRNKIQEKKPWLKDDYYSDFKTDSPLEQKYAARGSFETAHTVYDSDNKNIGKIYVYYPKELENSDKNYPLIMMVNGSNTRARNYLPFFDRLASWGFIVAGTDDPQAGTGETTSIALDYILNLGSPDVLSGKVDRDRIGITGYSQGGAGALGASQKYRNSNLYKAIFTGSAAYPYLAKNLGWEYDAAKITISCFMTAATGKSDDRGIEDINSDFAGVAPLKSLIEIYDAMPDDVTKIRARVTGAEHIEMQMKTDGYMAAWFLWQLCKDEDAAKVFIGDDAEILHNSNWQDIEKDK